MKKIFTVLAFLGTLLLGAQSVSAQSLKQDENRHEVIAKEEARIMTEDLGLNGDQTRATFRALVTHKVNTQKALEGKNENDPAVKSQIREIDETLEGTMKKILNEDQYSNWSKDRQ